ncbi:MAG: glycosyltransferase family 61 protein [Alphaproteobacteria bacterium]|nr:glycosyltransferase family 61 protein [Alphaproteobacteria bacterium]
MPEITPFKIYSDNKNIKYSNKIINQIKITSNASVISVDNPTIVVDTKTIAYGVFDSNGKFVKQSLQYRGKNHQFIPKSVPHDAPYIDSVAVLVGNIYPHFGHFLVEQMNRLFGAINQPRDIKYIFMDNRGIGAQNFVYEFMAAFGVDKNDIIILNKSARFKKLYIPSQTLNIKNAIIDNQMPLGYQKMAQNTTGGGYDRVYMSRAKLPQTIRTIGEEKIQKIFEKNGYKIIYPEQMSIAEQIAAVRDARYLAGCAGTALHWAFFMKPGGTVITLKRNLERDKFVQTQHMFNSVCGLKSIFVWASVEPHKSNHGGKHPPQIIGATQYIKQFFDDFGFKYTNSDIAIDNDAMKEYQEQYEKYISENGSTIRTKILKHMVKIISCFIPGRINRNRARKWLKSKLHI